MRGTSRRIAWIAALVLLAGACGTGGGLEPEGMPPRGAGPEVSGLVERVDAVEGRIVVATEDGASTEVHYRDGTPVWYRGQRYAVGNLEPGDRVRVQLDSFGEPLLARAIEVTQSRQERARAGETVPPAGEVATYLGEVDWIDPRRGEFDLRTEEGRIYTVQMREDASEADRRRFDQLERGDRVRVQAVRAAGTRLELVRFDGV